MLSPLPNTFFSVEVAAPRNVFTGGMPQTRTKTVNKIHGTQAEAIWPGE